MRFLKKNFWTLSCLALVMVMAVSGNALADGNTLMETAQTKAKSVFSSVKTIIFIVGGFGLVGLAFQAIFGKVKWPWFASLAVGLAILAAAGSIMSLNPPRYSGHARRQSASGGCRRTECLLRRSY